MTKGNDPKYVVLSEEPYRNGDIIEVSYIDNGVFFVHHYDDGGVGEPMTMNELFVKRNNEWNELMDWLHKK